jgi:DNA-binding MarR family transcriptional regulator
MTEDCATSQTAMTPRGTINQSRHLTIPRQHGVNSFSLSKVVAQLRCMSGPAKAILRALADRYPNIWPSVHTIARDAGYSATTARKYLRRFEAEGLISAMGGKRGGRRNTEQYVIHVERIHELLQTSRQSKILGQANPTSDDRNPTRGVARVPQQALAFGEQPNARHSKRQRQALGNIEENKQEKDNKEEQQQHEPACDVDADNGVSLVSNTQTIGQELSPENERQRFLKEQAQLFLEAGRSAKATGAHLDESWRIAQKNGIQVYLAGLLLWLKEAADEELLISTELNPRTLRYTFTTRSWALKTFIASPSAEVFIDKVRPFVERYRASRTTLLFLAELEEAFLDLTEDQIKRLDAAVSKDEWLARHALDEFEHSREFFDDPQGAMNRQEAADAKEREERLLTTNQGEKQL